MDKCLQDVPRYLLLKFGQNQVVNSWDIRWGFFLLLSLLGKVKPTPSSTGTELQTMNLAWQNWSMSEKNLSNTFGIQENKNEEKILIPKKSKKKCHSPKETWSKYCFAQKLLCLKNAGNYSLVLETQLQYIWYLKMIWITNRANFGRPTLCYLLSLITMKWN